MITSYRKDSYDVHPSSPSGSSFKILFQGCYPRCPVEQPFLEEATMKCVSMDQCGCYDKNGKHYNDGSKVPTATNCHTW